jgi:hypothetical protein
MHGSRVLKAIQIFILRKTPTAGLMLFAVGVTGQQVTTVPSASKRPISNHPDGCSKFAKNEITFLSNLKFLSCGASVKFPEINA